MVLRSETKMEKIIVVGAGFTGATIAREMADKGYKVEVYESRNHIGGNAYDFINNRGILIHPYGPHIFHTNSKKIFDWLSKFTDWTFYEHKVKTHVHGKLLDFPININTINKLYNLNMKNSAELEKFFSKLRIQHPKIDNSRQHVEASVGVELCELFFSNYTKKHWDLDLSDLSAGVASRIPYRTSFDDRYFEDEYQFMPKFGYTKMFEKILKHKNITVQLGKTYKHILSSVEPNKIYYTGEIDKFFNYKYGNLGYRSIRFEHKNLDCESFQSVATENYPNDKDYTRITEFKKLTGQLHKCTSIVYEYPTTDGDPYYPIPTKENKKIYKKYQKLASNFPQIKFCGRLGSYQYLNMDQAVGMGLAISSREYKCQEF